MKLAALIPMRHHSQRVPGKNYRPLAGKPLFHHITETLLSVPEVDTIVVDTDSEPVMKGLRQHFPLTFFVASLSTRLFDQHACAQFADEEKE